MLPSKERSGDHLVFVAVLHVWQGVIVKLVQGPRSMNHFAFVCTQELFVFRRPVYLGLFVVLLRTMLISIFRQFVLPVPIAECDVGRLSS